VTVNEVVNLNQIVVDCLESSEHAKVVFHNPGMRIELDLNVNLLNTVGSTVHLSKTIMNIVTNAAEAMPDGGAIRISTQNRYVDVPITGYDHINEGDDAVPTVSDSGSGMSAQDKEHIFEPFYTKKAMGKSGTGLGMAVVWGTVKDHRGYIDVQSAEGRGTTFRLYFPVAQAPAGNAVGDSHRPIHGRRTDGSDRR
jgi:signal transduction histidine kinase